MEFSFQTDDDTKRLFEIVVYFLHRYFDYTEEQGIVLVNRYYDTHRDVHDDDYYHHESGFRIAVRVHYFEGLKGKNEDFEEWKSEHGLLNAPLEATQQFWKLYLSQDR